MESWRAIGMTYLDYSSIAARNLRKALKNRSREDVKRRDVPVVKITPYKNGEPDREKTF
ncbi:protein stunted-like [Agrilus planipennis]|uniref:Protein stunted-like n=1 Tax=Agrilus planipennis TaxID=224129 RepID=A0A1W4XHP2_AGRPL|nr:protein stunted-like [Agrilus planipennis]